jgi:hypothetical protein
MKRSSIVVASALGAMALLIVAALAVIRLSM